MYHYRLSYVKVAPCGPKLGSKAEMLSIGHVTYYSKALSVFNTNVHTTLIALTAGLLSTYSSKLFELVKKSECDKTSTHIKVKPITNNTWKS